MKRKWIAMLLTAAVAAGTLTGCGSSGADSGTSGDDC